jgi:hypothetical protein
METNCFQKNNQKHQKYITLVFFSPLGGLLAALLTQSLGSSDNTSNNKSYDAACVLEHISSFGCQPIGLEAYKHSWLLFSRQHLVVYFCAQSTQF